MEIACALTIIILYKYRDYTRELDEVPVTKCLSYIHLADGTCYTNLAYLKGTCILHAVDM